MLTFEYTVRKGKKLWVPRALVPVRLCSSSGESVHLFRIDSGADFTVLPTDVAIQLGIVFSEQPTIDLRHSGGHSRAYVSILELCIDDSSGRSVHWHAEVAFSDLLGQNGILGYVGFLEFFDVTLGRKRFTIRPRQQDSEESLPSGVLHTMDRLESPSSSGSMPSVDAEAAPNCGDTSESESAEPETSSEEVPSEAIPLLIAQSRKSFLRDLPVLLKTKPKQWVAYSGDKQIDFDESSKTRLVQECLRRGYLRGTFLVCRIEPYETPELDFVPDV